jgi:hypothetical protein
MQKYYAHTDSVKVDSKEFDYYVELYLANQVDPRIAELEKALREIADKQSFHTIHEMREIANRALMVREHE